MSDNGHYAEWARFCARHGQDPITAVSTWIEAELDITAARAVNPNAYPIVTRPMDPQSATRRILGILIDFGWTPPNNYHQIGEHDHA